MYRGGAGLPSTTPFVLPSHRRLGGDGGSGVCVGVVAAARIDQGGGVAAGDTGKAGDEEAGAAAGHVSVLVLGKVLSEVASEAGIEVGRTWVWGEATL